MTLLEQIQKEFQLLPPEKQSEVLDFILFLQNKTAPNRTEKFPFAITPPMARGKGEI